jgi:hypothetical protein
MVNKILENVYERNINKSNSIKALLLEPKVNREFFYESNANKKKVKKIDSMEEKENYLYISPYFWNNLPNYFCGKLLELDKNYILWKGFHFRYSKVRKFIKKYLNSSVKDLTYLCEWRFKARKNRTIICVNDLILEQFDEKSKKKLDKIIFLSYNVVQFK